MSDDIQPAPKTTAPETMSATQPTSAMAITSLVLGIIAILLSWVPIINNIAWILAIIGTIFGIIGLVQTAKKPSQKTGKGLALAGLILSVIAFVLVIATQQVYVDAWDDSFNIVADTPTAVTNDLSVEADSDAPDDTNATTASAKYSITDEAVDTTSKPYSTQITGTFTNTTNKAFSSVSIEYTIFDADGNQIGTASAYTGVLEPNTPWKFEAGYYGSGEFASYRLASVHAW